MTYVGNYVINKSNIVKQNDKTYRLTHSDAMLSIRDKTLNRGKRLFAKVQACNIDTIFNGTLTIKYKNQTSTDFQKKYNIRFDLHKGDILEKINEYMNKLYEESQKQIRVWFENLENERIKITTTLDFNKVIQLNYIFDETLANFLGFEPNVEYFVGSWDEQKFTETLAPYSSLIYTNTIYFTHPNLIHSNFNRDNITAISHPIEQQINYEVMFEIRSLSPSANIEFFDYVPKSFENNNAMVKRRICPKDVCIILGFYEDEY